MDLGGTTRLAGAAARRITGAQESARLMAQSIRQGDGALGVYRSIVPKHLLELDPKLAGKLDVPLVHGARQVTVQDAARDIVAMDVNTHMGVPSQVALSNPANESIDGMRSVAETIVRQDPDIVVMQEVRLHELFGGSAGVPEQASVWAHLIGASDMSFTPAVSKITGLHDGYGTLALVRKGATFEQSHNAALINWDPAVEQRTLGVHAVRLKDGRALTLVEGHYDNDRDGLEVLGRMLRRAQLHDTGAIVDSIRGSGTFEYADAITGARHVATGMPSRHILVGADFNQTARLTDPVLNQYGLTNVNDLLERSGLPGAAARVDAARKPTSEYHGYVHHIDDWYTTSGVKITDSANISSGESLYKGGTDHSHPTIVAQLDVGPQLPID